MNPSHALMLSNIFVACALVVEHSTAALLFLAIVWLVASALMVVGSLLYER